MGGVFIALAIGILALPPEGLDDIVGRAAAVDGDTVMVNEQTVSLWGIDAPEVEQTCFDAHGAEWPCGVYAKHLLESQIGDAEVVCEPRGLAPDRTVIAICTIDGRDLAWAMVAFGFALDLSEISKGAYREPQAQSSSVRAGMWSGSFVTPREWRAARQRD